MTWGKHRYRAYGITFASTATFSDVCGARERSRADVHIAFGDVPPSLGPGATRGFKFEALPGRLLVKTVRVADILIANGTRMQVAPKPEAAPRAVENLLFGWALGGLLAQRGTLALHASSVDTGRGAVLFCGGSGAGKSTLACALAARGYPVVDDNVAALRAGRGTVVVEPGSGCVRLCGDTLEWLGLAARDLERLDHTGDKYLVRLSPAERCATPRDLDRIFVLRRGSALRVRWLTGSEKLRGLQDNVFVPRFMAALGAARGHFERLLAVARRVPTAALEVPAAVSLHELADVVAAGLGARAEAFRDWRPHGRA